MRDAIALRIAIDLIHIPSRVRTARSEPLPAGVYMVLCIASGEEAAVCEAVASTGRSRDVIQRAAVFFIEQVLLCPNADSYRVLGATCDATNSELRRNMALLMRWLHPDMDPEGRCSVFASRVTRAWNDLKTVERRAAYDREKRSMAVKKTRDRSMRPSSGKRLAASSRHGHGKRAPGHIHANQTRTLLRRLVAWMGALGAASFKVRT
jgi:DnaJ-class molecular chaperone